MPIYPAEDISFAGYIFCVKAYLSTKKLTKNKVIKCLYEEEELYKSAGKIFSKP
jgi:hypothetical protein